MLGLDMSSSSSSSSSCMASLLGLDSPLLSDLEWDLCIPVDMDKSSGSVCSGMELSKLLPVKFRGSEVGSTAVGMPRLAIFLLVESKTSMSMSASSSSSSEVTEGGFWMLAGLALLHLWWPR